MDKKIKQLDYAAFKKLFEELYPKLCRISIQMVNVAEIAEDIVQEQFIYLWENRSKINIYNSYEAYLYRAVKNKSIDYLKSKYAKLKFQNTESILDLVGENNNVILEEIQENEQAEKIAKAIELLPEKCRVIFSMSRFGDLSNKEIAEELGVSAKTVENQITIAIKKIKLALQKSKLLSVIL